MSTGGTSDAQNGQKPDSERTEYLAERRAPARLVVEKMTFPDEWHFRPVAVGEVLQ
jgi:hypothetical protein